MVSPHLSVGLQGCVEHPHLLVRLSLCGKAEKALFLDFLTILFTFIGIICIIFHQPQNS